MKNKRASVVILLFVSLLVWGMIGWKVYAGLQPAPSVLPTRKTVERPAEPAGLAETLLLNYRDPFLDDSDRLVDTSARQPMQAVPSGNAGHYEVPSEEVQPDFHYKGMIRVGKSFQAIVVSGEYSRLLQRGDKVDGFTVKSIAEEQLVVTRKGKSYKISIE